jgi:hypothetical protein
MTRADQSELSSFFTGKQQLDPTQIYPLLGEVCDPPAKKEVLFVVNTGAIAANAGDLQ